MWGRRGIYLAALAGCTVFYMAYREWLAWLTLLFAAGLPWVSLLLSLPAMLKTRVAVDCPEAVGMGEPFAPQLTFRCALPVAGVRGRLLLTHRIFGTQRREKNGARIVQTHCGQLDIQPDRVWVYDYLGIWRLRARHTQGCRVLVRPEAVVMEKPPDVSRYRDSAWKPKPGGGFAENHELRLYRPGDNLRQIHWKLSAKTGKPILREPMEPVRGLALVTLALRGTPEQVDRKLGRLLWVSGYLLEQGIVHRIRALTGEGLRTFEVSRREDVRLAVDALLGSPCAPADAVPDYGAAAWRCHIGGDPDGV